MNNKTLKRIYKLRYELGNANSIKIAMNKRYGTDITRSDITAIISGIELKYQHYFLEKLMMKFYQDFHNIKKAVEYLNTNHGTNLTVEKLRQKASRKGIKRKAKSRNLTRLITPEQENEIIKLYKQGSSSIELAEIYGYKTRKSITDKLKFNNIKLRDENKERQNSTTYSNFSFKEINTKEKAYIIGLLVSDGCVSDDRGYISIDLVDEDCIQFISKVVNVKYLTIKSKNKNHKDSYRITICGRHYLKQVERFGIVPRKSLSTKGCIINVDEQKYIPYILRGIIDGDGWIRKDGKEFFISSASEQFINWCKCELIKLGFDNIKYKFISNDSEGIYIIRTGIQSNIALLKDIIYNTPLGMQRKYKRLYEKNVQRL